MKRGAATESVFSKKSKNDVVFNDAAFDLDWLQMGGANSVNDIKLPEEQSATHRSGLGFKSDPLQNDKGVLSTRLTKMKQQKVKSRVNNGDEDDQEEEDIGHGIVEQIIDKTSLKSKQKSVFSADNSKKNIKPSQIESNSNFGSRNTISKVYKPNSEMLDRSTDIDKDQNASSAKKKDLFKERFHKENKRKKTRSKQKNIRKDNRPAEQRPNYRPITKETKVHMGIENV